VNAPDDRVRSLLRPEVLALSAYHVPDSTGCIKLDAMENPYAWPEEMVSAWLERLRGAEPNRYPDPVCAGLKAALKRANGVPDGAELLLGNGSDEIIQIILMAVAGPDVAVLAPEPTFVMYRQIAVSLGLRFIGVPLREADFALDADAMLAAIQAHRPAVVFLAYPNNPTGNLFEADAVERVIAAAPGLVVADEAYAPYANASFMPKALEHGNLLVMRTLSKLGLAGLRLGFLAGDRRWIEQLDKLRLPYNINVLTRISAEFALENQAVFDAQVRCLLRDRASLAEALARLDGLQIYDSRANFILFKLLRHEGPDIFRKLKADGILVKNLHPAGGMLAHCLRVTVGTPEENQRFLEALGQALG
jgi:histidinol-phosphate aminotransferase